MSRIVFVHTSQLISLMTAIHVKLHPSNPTFCMVLRNGLIVRRITYEPTRFRANVTRFFIQYHFSCSVFAHCPHHLRFLTHDYPPCETSPVKSDFSHDSKKRAYSAKNHSVSPLVFVQTSHVFNITSTVHTFSSSTPEKATRFSSSSMISFVLKCISHL